MGEFYGSIHVRTADRDAVRTALAAVMRSKRSQSLLAPTLNGWTTIYPELNGQDASISKALARKLSSDIVHVLVHDGDLFAYCVYRAGKLLDEYNSIPDYFEPVSPRKKKRFAGRPERYKDLLDSDADVAELQRLLADDTIGASEALHRFAEVLHLPNVLTAYEYLLDGETDGIESFDQFFRVPELSEADRRRAAAQAGFDAARHALREAGALLAGLPAPTHGKQSWRPLCCPAPSEGFLVCWSSLFERGETDILHWRPPWSGPPSPIGIRIDNRIYSMAISPSGRYLAAGFSSDNWSIQLWDLPERTLLADMSAAHLANSLAFSPEERLLAFRAHGQVGLVDCMTGDMRDSINLPGERLVVFHPGGHFIVADHVEGLAIIDVASAQLAKVLAIGGLYDTSAMHQHIVAQLQGQAKQMRKAAKRMRSQLEKLGEDTARQYDEQMEKYFEAIAGGELPGAGESTRHSFEQLRRVLFSTTGDELFAVTNEGVRSYAWASLLAADDCVPAPRIAVDAEPVEMDGSFGAGWQQGYTYDLLHDPAAHLLLCCGLAGCIRSIDLATGRDTSVTPRLGPGGLASLHRSRDGQHLCTTSLQPLERHATYTDPPLLVWHYPSLLSFSSSNA